MNIARGTATIVEVRLGDGILELNVSSRCVKSSNTKFGYRIEH